MVIIKSTGFTVKREHTPICEIFDMLNKMYYQKIINGYLVSVDEKGNLIINIIERG